MEDPMFPASLVMTGTDQTLRRERVKQGRWRTWRILPRYGTGNEDRWTLIATPAPAVGNPAATYEDGQYATLVGAWTALGRAEEIDNGKSEVAW